MHPLGFVQPQVGIEPPVLLMVAVRLRPATTASLHKKHFRETTPYGLVGGIAKTVPTAFGEEIHINMSSPKTGRDTAVKNEDKALQWNGAPGWRKMIFLCEVGTFLLKV